MTDEIGHVVDFVPTILELLKIEPNAELHGRSLLDVFFDKPSIPSKFYISGLKKFRMYREGQFKIVKMNNGSWELYNLKDDPTEQKDLSKNHPNLRSKLIKAYRKEKNAIWN